MTHPFEGNEPEPVIETGHLPCPECSSTRGYVRMGNFRVHCLGCNALLKNAEVNMQLPNKEQ